MLGKLSRLEKFAINQADNRPEMNEKKYIITDYKFNQPKGDQFNQPRGDQINQPRVDQVLWLQ
jgi:hypothetical protein